MRVIGNRVAMKTGVKPKCLWKRCMSASDLAGSTLSGRSLFSLDNYLRKYLYVG